MVVYGEMMLPAVWSYPYEIILAEESLIPKSVHRIALLLPTLDLSLVI